MDGLPGIKMALFAVIIHANRLKSHPALCESRLIIGICDRSQAFTSSVKPHETHERESVSVALTSAIDLCCVLKVNSIIFIQYMIRFDLVTHKNTYTGAYLLNLSRTNFCVQVNDS